MIVHENVFLPNKVIEGDFDFYLLLYSEELMYFTSEQLYGLTYFLNTLNIRNLEIKVLEGFGQAVDKNISHQIIKEFNPVNFKKFCSQPSLEQQNFELYMGTGYLKSINNEIVIYLDRGSEVVIVGVENKYSEKFEKIVQPYNEMSLHEKLNYICNIPFADKAMAKKFVEALIENYFKSKVIMVI